jgi:tetratricopeptide (TPR) repeat protein
MPVNDHTKQAMTAPTTPLFGLRQRQPLLGLVCILAALFFLDPAVGQEGAVGYVSPVDPANEYLDALDRIESEYGPYAVELSDLYLGLGQTLINRGDYEQARDAFYRGVMVVRVNSGPNSPEQTDHLYLLANIETLLGESKTADEILQNIYFINSGYYGEDNPKMLPVLERIIQWYYLMRPPPGSIDSKYVDYERTIELTKEMSKISEAAYGTDNPDTAAAYKRLGDAEFQMVRHMTGLGVTLAPDKYVFNTIGSMHPQTLGSDPAHKHYRAGRKAFKKYLESLEANQSTTPLEYAEALADLGDWFLAFEKPRKSRDLYEQGYQLLAASEEYAELADSFMNHPKPMHFIVNLQPRFSEETPMPLEEMNFDISMTVTVLGDVRHVEILDAPESVSEHDIREIKKLLGQTPFRPALKEGEVVTTKEFIWQYVIVPEESAS